MIGEDGWPVRLEANDHTLRRIVDTLEKLDQRVLHLERVIAEANQVAKRQLEQHQEEIERIARLAGVGR